MIIRIQFFFWSELYTYTTAATIAVTADGP